MAKFLGKTVQLYTTARCGMSCPHCSSRVQSMPDMDLRTFQAVVRGVAEKGAERVELFANDPLLHPQIHQQIAILNESGLGYALLTVGASPTSPTVRERLLQVMGEVNPEKGAFVFSVDLTREASQRIVGEERHPLFSYAFKANTFWHLAPLLKAAQIPVRSNTVITRHNIDQAAEIMSRVIEMGFAASFCFVQNRQAGFDQLLQQGLSSGLEGEFRRYLDDSGLLGAAEINQIVTEVHQIVARGELEDSTLFNAFRGDDRSEASIPEDRLAQLRKELLELKAASEGKVLPSESFISEIGQPGFGCIKLLQQMQFPQMKIGSTGQIIFCCDLHDPITQEYHIAQIDEQAFLRVIRLNPYIWLCVAFNSCDFSVNRVIYDAKA